MQSPTPSTRGARTTLALLLFGLQIPSRSQNSDPAPAASKTAPPHRVYSRLLDPREHPDYDRRAVKPPGWDTFKHRTQFTCLRGFTVQTDHIVGYAGEIEKFSRTFQLGDVIWPSYPILFAKNLGDLADEIKRRDLYLFDVWGYVPGSGPSGYWQQVKPPAEAFVTLDTKLGEHWLGTDIGEQDGRYIGGYANQIGGQSWGSGSWPRRATTYRDGYGMPTPRCIKPVPVKPSANGWHWPHRCRWLSMQSIPMQTQNIWTRPRWTARFMECASPLAL